MIDAWRYLPWSLQVNDKLDTQANCKLYVMFFNDGFPGVLSYTGNLLFACIYVDYIICFMFSNKYILCKKD